MMLAPMTLFLCGDVMTGRGIDQVLPESNDPELFESYVRDARDYVALAESISGPLPETVDYRYIWGDALDVLRRFRPDVSIVNLETSVTTSDAYWKGKGIHYRMHPANVEFLKVAGIDCCVLANNHVLDWGYPGLEETMRILRESGVSFAGVGLAKEARAPAILETEKGRLAVFSFASACSGVPRSWAAEEDRAGVSFLGELSEGAGRKVISHIQEHTRSGDIVVFSIHWGSNWGYGIPDEQVRFAHALIDSGAVDVVYGHSSHHVRPLEVYRGKLILYGCGDFLNDYEGISGHEEYRPDLALMYFPRLDPGTGDLAALEMIPVQIHKFSLHRASKEDAKWLGEVVERESTGISQGIRVSMRNGHLELAVNSRP